MTIRTLQDDGTPGALNDMRRGTITTALGMCDTYDTCPLYSGGGGGGGTYSVSSFYKTSVTETGSSNQISATFVFDQAVGSGITPTVSIESFGGSGNPTVSSCSFSSDRKEYTCTLQGISGCTTPEDYVITLEGDNFETFSAMFNSLDDEFTSDTQSNCWSGSTNDPYHTIGDGYLQFNYETYGTSSDLKKPISGIGSGDLAVTALLTMSDIGSIVGSGLGFTGTTLSWSTQDGYEMPAVFDGYAMAEPLGLGAGYHILYWVNETGGMPNFIASYTGEYPSPPFYTCMVRKDGIIKTYIKTPEGSDWIPVRDPYMNCLQNFCGNPGTDYYDYYNTSAPYINLNAQNEVADNASFAYDWIRFRSNVVNGDSRDCPELTNLPDLSGIRYSISSFKKTSVVNTSGASSIDLYFTFNEPVLSAFEPEVTVYGASSTSCYFDDSRREYTCSVGGISDCQTLEDYYGSIKISALGQTQLPETSFAFNSMDNEFENSGTIGNSGKCWEANNDGYLTIEDTYLVFSGGAQNTNVYKNISDPYTDLAVVSLLTDRYSYAGGSTDEGQFTTGLSFKYDTYNLDLTNGYFHYNDFYLNNYYVMYTASPTGGGMPTFAAIPDPSGSLYDQYHNSYYQPPFYTCMVRRYDNNTGSSTTTTYVSFDGQDWIKIDDTDNIMQCWWLGTCSYDYTTSEGLNNITVGIEDSLILSGELFKYDYVRFRKDLKASDTETCSAMVEMSW